MAKNIVSDSASNVKLTEHQRYVLELATDPNYVWNKCRDNQYQRGPQAPLQTLRKLEGMGLVEPVEAGDTRWTVGYTITLSGRAALGSAPTPEPSAAPPVVTKLLYVDEAGYFDMGIDLYRGGKTLAEALSGIFDEFPRKQVKDGYEYAQHSQPPAPHRDMPFQPGNRISAPFGATGYVRSMWPTDNGEHWWVTVDLDNGARNKYLDFELSINYDVPAPAAPPEPTEDVERFAAIKRKVDNAKAFWSHLTALSIEIEDLDLLLTLAEKYLQSEGK